MRGLQDLRAAFGALFASNPSVHVRIVQRMVLGQFVVDHEHITGRADGLELQALVAYQVVDGQIRQYWVMHPQAPRK